MQNTGEMVTYTSLTNIAIQTSSLWLPRAGSPCWLEVVPHPGLFLKPYTDFFPFLNLLQISPDPEDFINTPSLWVFLQEPTKLFLGMDSFINHITFQVEGKSSKQDKQIFCPCIPHILVGVMDRKP